MKILIKYIALIILGSMLYSCLPDDDIGPDTYDDPRDAYTGTWNCIEDEVKQKKIAYTVIISKDAADSNGLLLENFAYIGMGEYTNGIVNDFSVNVPEQVLSNGWEVEGIGSFIAENELYWEYTVKVGGDIISYKATFSR